MSGRREWTRPLRPGRRRGGHARAGSWRAGPSPAYGRHLADRWRSGHPRRRARLRFRENGDGLTGRLQQWITSKPERVRTWCSWQSWSTSHDLQLCQLEQKLDRPGLRGIEFSKSIEQTVCVPGLRKFSKCWKQPQICLVGQFWAICDHFHEMAIKQLLFLIKFATTLL